MLIQRKGFKTEVKKIDLCARKGSSKVQCHFQKLKSIPIITPKINSTEPGEEDVRTIAFFLMSVIQGMPRTSASLPELQPPATCLMPGADSFIELWTLVAFFGGICIMLINIFLQFN